MRPCQMICKGAASDAVITIKPIGHDAVQAGRAVDDIGSCPPRKSIGATRTIPVILGDQPIHRVPIGVDKIVQSKANDPLNSRLARIYSRPSLQRPIQIDMLMPLFENIELAEPREDISQAPQS